MDLISLEHRKKKEKQNFYKDHRYGVNTGNMKDKKENAINDIEKNSLLQNLQRGLPLVRNNSDLQQFTSLLKPLSSSAKFSAIKLPSSPIAMVSL